MADHDGGHRLTPWPAAWQHYPQCGQPRTDQFDADVAAGRIVWDERSAEWWPVPKEAWPENVRARFVALGLGDPDEDDPR